MKIRLPPSIFLFIIAVPVWLCAACFSLSEKAVGDAAESDIQQNDSGRGRQHIIHGNPSNYIRLVKHLRPGNTLVLGPGVYDDPNEVPGLPIFGLHGEPEKPIVITGPENGERPVLLARTTHNTIRIVDSSYVVIRNLVLDGRNLGVDAVKAQGISHHITLENLLIINHGNNQQTVGISTKAPAWNWVVRGNIIKRAGTGMYLGHPDGTSPFVAGVIENNLIVDTIGYNIEIKHQKSRADIPEMPVKSMTVIRHNVFSKMNNGATGGMARPNLLVGHFPLSGPGADDSYAIYGNFFYQNPTGECLFQGEGNIALYSNLFYNSSGDAVCIQPHNDVPRRINVFYNTVVAQGIGIKVVGADSAYPQMVMGNAVFASSPIRAADESFNIIYSFSAASRYLVNPGGQLGQFSLVPKPGQLIGSGPDSRSLRSFPDWDRDFNGERRVGNIRGAYAETEKNHAWFPMLERKPYLMH